MFNGFIPADVDGPAGLLRTLRGGAGAPLLLLHGHPQTHAMWHRVAAQLAARFTVVMRARRGDGDVGKAIAEALSAA